MPIGTTQDSRDPNSPQWGYLKVEDPSELQYDAKDHDWNNFVLFVHDQEHGENQIDPIKFSQVSNQKGAIRPGTKVEFEMIQAALNVDGVAAIPSEKATPGTRLWVARITDVFP